MYSIEILLPIFDNGGRRIAKRHFRDTATELTQRFGGLTAHTRAPVEGLWSKGARAKRDVMVIYEVNSPRLDRRWWRGYRRTLERRFRQEEIQIIAVRAQKL